MEEALSGARAKHRRAARANVFERLYPEYGAGGFSRCDLWVPFFIRVNALLRPDMTVVDYGAGRGFWAEEHQGFLRELMLLQGKVRKVIGIDVDPAVLANPVVDERLIFQPNGRLPLADASVDLIVAKSVLEHIERPEAAVAEIARVLRPGGWFCAWTPNRWGYIGIGARLVPDRWHAKLLRRVEPTDRRRGGDVFPAYYRMNTLGAIRRLFPADAFEHCSYVVNGLPTYNLGSIAMARLIQLYGRLTPPRLGQFLHVFVRKRP
jgi:SAM-dependent methyltransferase